MCKVKNTYNFSEILHNSRNCTLSDTNCTTMSGPDPNALCIFPFEYNGEIFNECTDKEHDQMWCHTSEDWGNCGPDCTFSSGIPSSSTPMSVSGKYFKFFAVKMDYQKYVIHTI